MLRGVMIRSKVSGSTDKQEDLAFLSVISEAAELPGGSRKALHKKYPVISLLWTSAWTTNGWAPVIMITSIPCCNLRQHFAPVLIGALLCSFVQSKIKGCKPT